MSKEDIYILGIESSCDDTAAAILKNDEVLSNCIANQEIHKKYGGVVPELASRAHLSNIIPVVSQALDEAKINPEMLSAIAFIVYNLSKSFDSMKNLDTDEKSLHVASVVIVLVFLLSTVHYQVMFQVGLVEIFCLHLAYIISVATRKHEAPSG